MSPKEGLNIDRRSWLKTLGAGAASLAAVGKTAAADTSDYDRVVNVAEAGAARDASEPINDVLEEHRGDSVLFEFPEGEYLMDRKFRHTGFDEFGMVGDGATIVPAPADEFESQSLLFKLGTYYSPGGMVTVENITFDFTADNTGARALQVQSDDMRVSSVTFTGVHDSGTWGPVQFDVMDPDTTAIVEDVRMPDGGEFTRNTSQDASPTVDTGPTGFLVSPYNVGTIVVRDCEVGPFPDNGLYASSTDGCVVVEGGTYRNSNVANIRLSGQGCVIDGATIIVDQNRDRDVNQRGIRLDQGDGISVSNTDILLSEPNGEAVRVTSAAGTTTLEGLDVELADASTSNDAIAVSGGAGETTITGSHVDIDCPGQAFVFESGSEGRVVAERITVTGDASGDIGGRHAIICDRDDCELHDFAVEQPGSGYRRALRISGDNVTVSGGRFHSTHHPIVNDASGTHIEGITAWADGETEAAKFHSGNANVSLVDSVLYDGIVEYGTVTTSGNEYPEGEPDEDAVTERSDETDTGNESGETEYSETEYSETGSESDTSDSGASESSTNESSTTESSGTDSSTSESSGSSSTETESTDSGSETSTSGETSPTHDHKGESSYCPWD